MDFKIRNVKIEDIETLCVTYKELYDNIDIGEYWTENAAKELLNYYYNKQKDLFFVAEIENKVVGAVMSLVKPWFDGNRLIETEVFVSKDFQRMHIARELYKKHFKEAIKLYSCNVIEFHTYGNEDEHPQNWYKRIGFSKDEELIIMNGKIKDILNKM